MIDKLFDYMETLQKRNATIKNAALHSDTKKDVLPILNIVSETLETIDKLQKKIYGVILNGKD